MTLSTFSDKELTALETLAREKEMSQGAVLRQALRMYQLIHERTKAGETFSFSGDARRAAEFKGVDLEELLTRAQDRLKSVTPPKRSFWYELREWWGY